MIDKETAQRIKAATGMESIDMLIAKHGLDDSDVAELINETRADYSFINGGERGSSVPSIEETNRDLEQYHHIRNYITPAAAFLVNRKIQDKFDYETSPALRGIARSGSEFSRIIGNALKDAETEKFQFGQRARLAFGIGYGLIRGLPAAVRFARGAARVMRAGRMVARVASVASAASTPATGPAGVAAAVVLALVEAAIFSVGEFIAQQLGEKMAEDYVYSRSAEKMAAEMFDKTRVVDAFKTFSGGLAGIRGARGDGGFPMLERLRTSSRYGVTLGEAGYDYNALGPLVSAITAATNVTSAEEVESLALDTASYSTFLGVDDNSVLPSITTLARMNEGNLSRVSQQFEDFFAAFSGDGSIITSQLSMVDAMISFSHDYGRGMKLQASAPEELLKAVAFLSGGEMGRIQSVESMTKTISTLDDLLMSGALLTNPRANELLSLSGITMGQAVRGISGDGDIVPKLMRGFSRKLGITEDSFSEDGELNERGYRMLSIYMIDSLGMTMESIGQVVDAMSVYFTGRKDTRAEVRSGGFQSRAKRYKNDEFIPNYSDTVAELNNKLIDITKDNANAMADIHGMIMDTMTNAVNATLISADYISALGKLLNIEGVNADYVSPERFFARSHTNEELANRRIKDSVNQELVMFYGGPRMWDEVKGKVEGAIMPTYMGKDALWRERARSLTFEEFIQALPAGRRENVTPQFLESILSASEALGVDFLDLFVLMGIETGWTFSPDEPNRAGSGAVGLIQFMPTTAKGLGTSSEKLANMSASEQMKYVVKYLKGWVKPGMDLTELYLAILFPAAIGRPDSFVLMGKDGHTDADGTFFGMKALKQNEGLDLNKDQNITKGEIRQHLLPIFQKTYVNLIADGATSKEGIARSLEQSISGQVNQSGR